MLSIGIPTYNRLDKLKRAVNGVLNQSFAEWELIISDDCSYKAGIREYLDMLSKNDNRIKVFFQTQNIGVKNNYLFVYHKARGAFFTWLSDDDYYHSSDHLQNMMEKTKDDYDLIFPDLKKIRQGKKVYRSLSDRNMPISVHKRFRSHLLLIIKGYLGYQVMFGVFKKNKLDEALPHFLNQTNPDEGAMTNYCLANLSWCRVNNAFYIKDMSDSHLYRLPLKRVFSYLYPHCIAVIKVLLKSKRYTLFQRVLLSCLYVFRIIYIAIHVMCDKVLHKKQIRNPILLHEENNN